MPTRDDATFQAVVAIIDRNRTEKDHTFPNGARLVCNLTWIHHNSWLHRVMPPCSEDAVASLAPKTGRQPPRELVDFLRHANGVSLFNGSLSIFGVRGDFSRNPETAQLLPYDLANHHWGWSRHFNRDDFLVGSCGPDVNPCVWRAFDASIDRIDQTSGDVLESWPSFQDWLIGEAEWFSSCHHADGHLVEALPIPPGKTPPWPQDPHVVPPPRIWSPAWWWELEKRLHLPFDTLPFGWVRKFELAMLTQLANLFGRKVPGIAQPDCNASNSGVGRVLDVFTTSSRGTVVVIEIIGGVWRAGSDLVAAKGTYRILAIDAGIGGKDLPLTACGIVIEHIPPELQPNVGEEVHCVSLPST